MIKVHLPGSKSITNRALILAALSDETMTLKGILESDDSKFMRTALRSLGVKIQSMGTNTVKITPPQKLIGTNQECFIGNAGTAARFLSALSLVAEGTYTLKGVERMHERPQADLLQTLRTAGIKISCLKNEGFLPARFENPSISSTKNKLNLELSGKTSSQFLTGLLLVGAKCHNGLALKITDSIPSLPYIKMTVEMLRVWGIKIQVSSDWLHYDIAPGIKSPKNYQIPADMSAASYPIAWSILKKQPIEIQNFGAHTLQGDEGFLEIAAKAGARIKKIGDKCQILPNADVQPIGDFNWESMPDVSMSGMILAAFAPKGTQSTFTGLESLRVKECDRILAMQQLEKVGFKIHVIDDVFTIWGNGAELPQGQTKKSINSFDDHRIAFCFGILKSASGLGSDPHQKSDIQISEPNCVSKTWPEFWLELADWERQLRSVAAIITWRENTQEYLIVKKPRQHNAWQFPQGGVDPGETLKQAALRELKEECGDNINVKIKGERPVGTYKYLFPKDFDRHDAGTVGARVEFFLADYISGEVQVDGVELVDHKWVRKEKLTDYFEGEYFEKVQSFL